MDTTIEQFRFSVTQIPEYNYLLELAREMNLVVLNILPCPRDGIIYDITVQGEPNHIRFTEFLLKKKTKQMKRMMKKVKVKE